MRRPLVWVVRAGAVLVGTDRWTGFALVASSRRPVRPYSRAVAVDTAVAARRDVPVYLEGLGNVQAFYTAKINSRVDGQLERVASPKVSWSRRANCWRRSIRGRCRRRSSRRARCRPRMMRSSQRQAGSGSLHGAGAAESDQSAGTGYAAGAGGNSCRRR